MAKRGGGLLTPKMPDYFSVEKSLILGKIKGRRRRGHQRMKWLDDITDAINTILGKLWRIVRDRYVWCRFIYFFSV